MKIKSVTCPNCGSFLKADETESRIKCEFCGSLVIVEDSRTEGYNFEKGSEQAKLDSAKKLASEVNDLIGPYCHYGQAKTAKASWENKIDANKKSIDFYQNNGRLVIYIVCGLFSLMMLFMSVRNHMSIPVFMLMGVISVLSFPLMAYLFIRSLDTARNNLAEAERNAKAEENRLSEFDRIIEEHKSVNLAPKYRNEPAMVFIRDHLLSNEAINMEQAVTQYESYLKQQEIIRLQQETINLQKQQLNNNAAQRRPAGTVSGFSGGVRSNNGTVMQGHSLIFHICLLLFCGIGLITIPYITLSKNHYWHM